MSTNDPIITDDKIDLICRHGRQDRWEAGKGNGAAYDRATVRKVLDYITEHKLWPVDERAEQFQVAAEEHCRAVDIDPQGKPDDVMAQLVGRLIMRGPKPPAPPTDPTERFTQAFNAFLGTLSDITGYARPASMLQVVPRNTYDEQVLAQLRQMLSAAELEYGSFARDYSPLEALLDHHARKAVDKALATVHGMSTPYTEVTARQLVRSLGENYGGGLSNAVVMQYSELPTLLNSAAACVEADNVRLRQQVDELRKDRDTIAGHNLRLQEQVDDLRRDRDHFRDRLHKLSLAILAHFYAVPNESMGPAHTIERAEQLAAKPTHPAPDHCYTLDAGSALLVKVNKPRSIE